MKSEIAMFCLAIANAAFSFALDQPMGVLGWTACALVKSGQLCHLKLEELKAR